MPRKSTEYPETLRTGCGWNSGRTPAGEQGGVRLGRHAGAGHVGCHTPCSEDQDGDSERRVVRRAVVRWQWDVSSGEVALVAVRPVSRRGGRPGAGGPAGRPEVRRHGRGYGGGTLFKEGPAVGINQGLFGTGMRGSEFIQCP